MDAGHMVLDSLLLDRIQRVLTYMSSRHLGFHMSTTLYLSVLVARVQRLILNDTLRNSQIVRIMPLFVFIPNLCT